MMKVIGVRFEQTGHIYYYQRPKHLKKWQTLVVAERRGYVQLGKIICMKDIEDNHVNQVMRIASSDDIQSYKRNQKDAKKAMMITKQQILESDLDMKLINIEYSLDRSKMLFYFTADDRVDFRILVRKLAAIFKTRIELRQVGVRDEAKIVGGLGPCGRPLCCNTFLDDFIPVSIKMAKDQNLSLNPTKISGLCSRLMCCLKYEDEAYKDAIKELPDVGCRVITPDGEGVVSGLNILAKLVQVRLDNREVVSVYDYSEIQTQKGEAHE